MTNTLVLPCTGNVSDKITFFKSKHPSPTVLWINSIDGHNNTEIGLSKESVALLKKYLFPEDTLVENQKMVELIKNVQDKLKLRDAAEKDVEEARSQLHDYLSKSQLL